MKRFIVGSCVLGMLALTHTSAICEENGKALEAKKVAAMIWDIFGWTGAFLLLGAYFILATGRLQPNSKIYIWMNLFGGIMMVTNTIYLAAYPSAVSNGVWVGITVVSLLRLR